MSIEPIITFHDLDPSEPIKDLIQRRTARLERLAPRMVSCHVTLEAPQRRKVHGRVMQARVVLSVPGQDIATGSDVAQGSARTDLKMAVNRAFTKAEKQIVAQRGRMGRLEVKHHAPVLHGVLTEIEPELGYGWARSDDGRDVYVQRDALTEGDWAELAKGDRLRFRIEDGEKGPFATGVTAIDGASPAEGHIE